MNRIVLPQPTRLFECVFITVCIYSYSLMVWSIPGYAQNIDSLRRVVERSGNDSTKVDVLCSIANTLARSAPEQSLEFGTQALTIAQKLNSTHGKAIATYNIANAHYRLGNYLPALDYCTQSRNLYEELHDTRNVARCMNRIGTIHKNQQNYKQALEALNESFKLYAAANDSGGAQDQPSPAPPAPAPWRHPFQPVPGARRRFRSP